MNIMNTKGVILCGTILTIGVGILYVWLDRKKKKEPEQKPEPWKPITPETLLKKLMEDILREDKWKNERDFLSLLSKGYIEKAPDITWIDYLPMNQEDMMEKMGELGCLGEYEKKLEERYIR